MFITYIHIYIFFLENTAEKYKMKTLGIAQTSVINTFLLCSM